MERDEGVALEMKGSNRRAGVSLRSREGLARPLAVGHEPDRTLQPSRL
jgi:hypothetical protein